MLAEWELEQFHHQHLMYVEYNPAVPLISSDGYVEHEKDKDKYVCVSHKLLLLSSSSSSSSSRVT